MTRMLLALAVLIAIPLLLIALILKTSSDLQRFLGE